MKFKAGDKVTTDDGDGIIKAIEDDLFAVEHYISKSHFHSCCGHTKQKHGYWYCEYDLEHKHNKAIEMFMGD